MANGFNYDTVSEPFKIPIHYSRKLTRKSFKFQLSRSSKLYSIHEIDYLNETPMFKYVTVMRLMKRAFGDIIFQMNSKAGRKLNAILSFWRRNGLEHLQQGGYFRDLIILPVV